MKAKKATGISLFLSLSFFCKMKKVMSSHDQENGAQQRPIPRENVRNFQQYQKKTVYLLMSNGDYRFMELRRRASSNSGRFCKAVSAAEKVTHCRVRLWLSGHWVSSRSTVTSKKW